MKTEVIYLSSLPAISALASFGGICVMFQCISMINGVYPLKHFIVSRFFNAFLSYSVTKIFLVFWNISLPASSAGGKLIFDLSPQRSATVFLIVMFIILMQKSEKIFKKG